MPACAHGPPSRRNSACLSSVSHARRVVQGYGGPRRYVVANGTARSRAGERIVANGYIVASSAGERIVANGTRRSRKGEPRGGKPRNQADDRARARERKAAAAAGPSKAGPSKDEEWPTEEPEEDGRSDGYVSSDDG
jgi:hypothetical protein